MHNLSKNSSCYLGNFKGGLPCRSLIYGISLDPNKQAGIGVNAANFHFSESMPESFKSVRHIWYENRIINFDDNLPKFKDAPKEQFGSGKLWNEDDAK